MIPNLKSRATIEEMAFNINTLCFNWQPPASQRHIELRYVLRMNQADQHVSFSNYESCLSSVMLEDISVSDQSVSGSSESNQNDNLDIPVRNPPPSSLKTMEIKPVEMKPVSTNNVAKKFKSSINIVKRRILIVDDEVFNIQAIKIIMKYFIKLDPELVCDTAQNGEDAVDKIKKNVMKNNRAGCDYSLILMDCNMPFMDGYEAA
jgi:CheY-like chemotaxis protein